MFNDITKVDEGRPTEELPMLDDGDEVSERTAEVATIVPADEPTQPSLPAMLVDEAAPTREVSPPTLPSTRTPTPLPSLWAHDGVMPAPRPPRPPSQPELPPAPRPSEDDRPILLHRRKEPSRVMPLA